VADLALAVKDGLVRIARHQALYTALATAPLVGQLDPLAFAVPPALEARIAARRWL